jgi:tetratricopeptide (TPR) repeat protein
VQGFIFEPDLIAQILERRRIGVLRDLAEIERRRGIVRAARRAYRFDHHQIQEVVYAALPEGLRVEYQAMTAKALARDGLDELQGERALRVARHHLHGGRTDEAAPLLERAVEYLRLDERVRTIIGNYERLITIPDLIVRPVRSRIFGHLGSAVRLQAEKAMGFQEVMRFAGTPAGTHVLREWFAAWIKVFSRPEWREIYPLLRDAGELAREAGDVETEALCEGARGGWHYGAAQFDRALEHLTNAIGLFRRHGDRVREAGALHCRAVFCDDLDWHEEARRLYERALSLCREIDAGAAEAAVAANLAALHLHSGRVEEALGLARSALRRSVETGSSFIECICHHRIGENLHRIGDLDGARDHLERSILLARNLGESSLEAEGLESLSGLLLDGGDVSGAESHYRQALALYRDLRRARSIARTHRALGIILAGRGRTTEAVRLLRRSLGLSRRVGSPDALAAIRLAILDEIPVAEAVEAFEAQQETFGVGEAMEARYALFRATGERVHLEEAHRLLTLLRDHAREQYRESMIANVPLHRDIMAAWEEHEAEG